jgi:hypothetical protein
MQAQVISEPVIDTALTTSKIYFYNGEIVVPYSNGNVSILNNAEIELLSTTEVTLLPGFTASVDSGCGEFVGGLTNCPQIQIHAELTMIKCRGMDNGRIKVNLVNGNSPFIYSWSNDLSGSSIVENLNAGTYNLTVTDQNGCSASEVFNILEPDSLTSTVTTTPSECHEANGSAVITALGGNGNFKFNWISDGYRLSDRSDLLAGLYEVLIVDSLGCSKSINFGISDIDGPQPNVTIDTHVKCNGGNDASVSVSLPYSGPEPFMPICGYPDRLAGGVHYIVQEDTLGCKSVLVVNIPEPDPIKLDFLTVASNCGQSSGSIQVEAIGGVGTFSYLWDNGSTSVALSNIPSGKYSVIVTDENGCSASKTSIVLDTIDLLISTEVINVSCYNGDDGVIKLSVAGGVAPYTYSFEDGKLASNENTNLEAGDYKLYVKDYNNCTNKIVVKVEEPRQLNAIVEISQPTDFNSFDGSASVNVTGGVSPYSYIWSNGVTTSSQFGLGAENIIISIRDKNNCSIIDTLKLFPLVPDSMNTFRTSNKFINYNSSAYCQTPQHFVLNIVSDFGAIPNDQLSDHQAFECANAYIVQYYCSTGTPVTLVIPPGTYIVGKQDFRQGGFYMKGNNILEFSGCSNVTIRGVLDANFNSPIIKFQDCLSYGAFEHRQGPNYGMRYLHAPQCCRYDESPLYNSCATVRDPVTQAIIEGCSVSPNIDCVCNQQFGTWRDYSFGAYPGNFLNLEDCENFQLENLEINGNVDNASIGGFFAADMSGIQQLSYIGINLLDSRDINIQNVNVHHFGMDGIQIKNQQFAGAMNINISASKFNWNCRSGMSWVSGSSVIVGYSEFNFNGYGPWGGSATRNGVDIEYEDNGQDLAEGHFQHCSFMYNAGNGVQSDAGADQYSPSAPPHASLHTYNFYFQHCTFVKGNSWCVWPNARNFRFKCCDFYGPLVRPFDAGVNNPQNQDFSTKFIKCTFNEEYTLPNSGGVKFAFTNDQQTTCNSATVYEHPYLLNFDPRANRAILDQCRITTNYYNKWGIFTGGSQLKDRLVIRNTDFINTGLDERTPNGSIDANRILAKFQNADISQGNRVFIAHNSPHCLCPNTQNNQYLFCWQVNSCVANNVNGKLKMMSTNGGNPCDQPCGSGVYPVPDGYTDLSYTSPHPCSPKWPGVSTPSIRMTGDCDPPNCSEVWEPVTCTPISPNANRKKNMQDLVFKGQSIIIAPVPSHNEITVSNYSDQALIIIRSVLGKEMMKIQTEGSQESTKILISDLPSGVYYIESKYRATGKFVKF